MIILPLHEGTLFPDPVRRSRCNDNSLLTSQRPQDPERPERPTSHEPSLGSWKHTTAAYHTYPVFIQNNHSTRRVLINPSIFCRSIEYPSLLSSVPLPASPEQHNSNHTIPFKQDSAADRKQLYHIPAQQISNLPQDLHPIDLVHRTQPITHCFHFHFRFCFRSISTSLGSRLRKRSFTGCWDT